MVRPLHARATAVRRAADPGGRGGRRSRDHRDVGLQRAHRGFQQAQDGLLGISCVGERKFRVQRVWRASDGLNMGEVEWLDRRAACSRCRRARAAARDRAPRVGGARRACTRTSSASSTMPRGSAARLAELLPIAPDDKQALLELEDPLAGSKRCRNCRAGTGVSAARLRQILASDDSRATDPSPREHHPPDESVVVAQQPRRGSGSDCASTSRAPRR